MAKDKPNLDETARVTLAMNAAGRSTRVAEHLPEKYQTQLAALVTEDGKIVPGVRDKVITILRNCREENKAEVDGMTEDDNG